MGGVAKRAAKVEAYGQVLQNQLGDRQLLYQLIVLNILSSETIKSDID